MSSGRHANVADSTTGDIAQVAAFFRVSVRTVANWYKASPPAISVWQFGHNICFGEEAVVDLRVKKMTLARAMEPGEAREIARKEWREHLGIGMPATVGDLEKRLADMQRRIELLEKRQPQMDADERGWEKAA